ncbi:MAG: N-formylglutamate amidohydrolase [Rhodobacteraceae bacterium]|nr:N-formylglutamate amidohydrolase [Paracoccaceae bacterium]
MSQSAFQLSLPNKRLSSVVFASPHSCATYPSTFVQQSVLDEHTIRSSEDAFVDKLFASAPEFGAPLLMAGAPRAYVDMNRNQDELDPSLIEGAKRQALNPRVASGLGVIPRVVANGREIYRGKMPMAEAQRRIETYWRPYHQMLQGLLDEAKAIFGHAILIDCHSMPNEAMDGISRIAKRRPEIVLGDRFGAAASAEIVDRIESAFTAAGLEVARNAPFAGAYVTQAYGRPSRHQHAIQVEIDRAIYMDERRIVPNENFSDFQQVLRKVIAEITNIDGDFLTLAAE